MNEWRLTPRFKQKLPPENSKSLLEVSYFDKHETKETLMNKLLKDKDFYEVFDKWIDFDYDKAFNLLEQLDDEERRNITLRMLQKLKGKTIQELMTIGGKKALKDAFTYMYENMPDIFNTIVKKYWPDAEDYL